VNANAAATATKIAENKNLFMYFLLGCKRSEENGTLERLIMGLKD
jgi:hypothetical protein